MPPMPAIEVRDLHKQYGSNHAVRGVSFTVERGEVFALLGPNGAGKSTTVEILEGHRAATSGYASVLDEDPNTAGRTFRNRIGVVLQLTSNERELTPREIITTYGAAYTKRARTTDELLDLVGLTDKADDRVKTLSGGQQRRVDLAVGLVGNPEILFLDEPTTGFDPAARRNSWEMLDALRSVGTTILLTTHYMDEAQHLADRVAVISEGQIVAEGPPETLGVDEEGLKATNVRFKVPPTVSLPGHFVAAGTIVDGMYLATTSSPTQLLAEITGWAEAEGIELEDLHVARPTLEEVYLALVGAVSDE